MTEEFCDVLGKRWYNRCWRSKSSHLLYYIAESTGAFFNLVPIGVFSEVLIVISYFVEIENSQLLERVLHHIHRLLLVPLCTILGLYLTFRQKRPCGIPNTDKAIGSAYGMPSGDSLASAAFATSLFPYCPILAIALFFLVPFSRVIRGYHSILQVIVGSMFGVCYSLLLTHGGDTFILINWVLAFVLPLLTLFDPAMKKQRKNDHYNYCSWLISNLGILSFDIAVCAPSKYDLFSNYSKRVVSMISIIVATILRVIQYIGAEDGWVFTLV